MFTKKDLKPFYVVKYRGGQLRIVVVYQKDFLISHAVVDSNCGNPLSLYTDDLLIAQGETNNNDIMEVYGYSNDYFHSFRIETENRPLLWKREEPQPIDVTMAEVIEKFGHPVRIVKEKE